MGARWDDRGRVPRQVQDIIVIVMILVLFVVCTVVIMNARDDVECKVNTSSTYPDNLRDDNGKGC